MYLSKYVQDLYAETLMEAIKGENWKCDFLIPRLTVKLLESGQCGIRETINIEIQLGRNRTTYVGQWVFKQRYLGSSIGKE